MRNRWIYGGVVPFRTFSSRGLSRLEYRGYDSAGVAIEQDGKLEVVHRKGKVSSLAHTLGHFDFTGTCGIGHTRWATHGRPSEANAHPHTSCNGRIAVVHNGIIENFAELREELEGLGHVFTSQTDTEVIPHLVEEAYRESHDLMQAVREAAERLIGAYAIAVVSSDEPGTLVVSRKDSPLVVGLAGDGAYVASDIIAVIDATTSSRLQNHVAAHCGGLPVTGAVFYLWWGNQGVTPKNARKFADIERAASAAMVQDDAVTEALYAREPAFFAAAWEYLSRNASAPLYCNTQSEYYPMGQDFFSPVFLEVIRGAKKYIFMEYFIVEEGEMWNETLAVLKEKSRRGRGRAPDLRRLRFHVHTAR